MFDSIKEDYNYTTIILHVTSPETVRIATENKRRAKKIVQCTSQDFITKGKMFCERLLSYTENADEIRFYYREKHDSDCQLAAILKEGVLEIKDKEAFDSIKQEHIKHVSSTKSIFEKIENQVIVTF